MFYLCMFYHIKGIYVVVFVTYDSSIGIFRSWNLYTNIESILYIYQNQYSVPYPPFILLAFLLLDILFLDRMYCEHEQLHQHCFILYICFLVLIVFLRTYLFLIVSYIFYLINFYILKSIHFVPTEISFFIKIVDLNLLLQIPFVIYFGQFLTKIFIYLSHASYNINDNWK